MATLSRALIHETSLPGVFAVGDVRHGSIKRVASGAGEGSVVVAELHPSVQPARS
jgi:thioredoxin reductase (NADPH)